MKGKGCGTEKYETIFGTHPLNPRLLFTGDEVLTAADASLAAAAVAAAAVSVTEIDEVRENQHQMNYGCRCTFAPGEAKKVHWDHLY